MVKFDRVHFQEAMELVVKSGWNIEFEEYKGSIYFLINFTEYVLAGDEEVGHRFNNSKLFKLLANEIKKFNT